MAKKPASKKKPLAQRLAASPALVKKYQKDPGLRSKYLTGSLEKYLTSGQRKTRALNTRLNAPIAPGSSTTERDLAHEAQAAQTVRYGPQDRAIAQQLGVAQQTERDTGGLYDQYRQALQQHSAAVQAFQAGAQQALGATAAGITGLGSDQAAQMQAQANAAAQPGVAPAGDLSTLANQALAVRQGVMGTFQGEQALRGAAANVYSDTQANVVAPGQKLSALAQARGRTRDVRQKQADLATEEGAFNQQFRQERRGEEFKNQLAVQTLAGNQANMAADNAIAASKAATDAASKTPEAAAAKTSATASASTAAKYGYTAHQWAMLGPTRRAQIIKSAKKTASGGGADTVYTGGAFAGRKKSDIAAMSDAERQKIVRDYNAGKGPGGKPVSQSTQFKRDFRRKYGVDPLPTESHNTFKDQVSQAQRVLKLVGSPATKDGKPTGKNITTDQVVQAMTTGGSKGIPKLPAVVVRAALDIARYGHITPGTANRLHHAGYSVATLGLKTGRSTRRPARPGSRNPSGPTSGPSAQVPGIGGGNA